MSLPYMHEHTCDNCKGIFYTEWFPTVPAEITDPQFCPFCGIKFNYKRPTEGAII